MMVGGNFAIRRDVLEKMGGFDRTIEFYGEDVDIGKRARSHGKVLFSPRFVMPTSGRRMRKQGFARIAGLYFANYLSIAVRASQPPDIIRTFDEPLNGRWIKGRKRQPLNRSASSKRLKAGDGWRRLG
jgi:GT2 family glycosyltransferase